MWSIIKIETSMGTTKLGSYSTDIKVHVMWMSEISVL